MSTKQVFLKYTIYLTDKDLVDQLSAAVHAGGGVGVTVRSPDDASTFYNVPIQLDPTPFDAPCIRSEWFLSQFNYPRNVRTFERCKGGWFGICFLFGTRTRYFWRGEFVYSAPAVTVPIPGETPVAMAQRRWIDGFELPFNGEGGTGNSGASHGRMASRHISGYGLGLRDSATTKSHTPIESGGAATVKLWERFYIRVRRYPFGADGRIWRCHGATSAAAGIALDMNATGQIQIKNIDNLGTIYPHGATAAIPLHQWHKVDLIYKYAITSDTEVAFEIYLNGILAFTSLHGEYAGQGGISQAQNISNSELGGSNTGTFFAIDYDDWIGMDWPPGGTVSTANKPGQDWNNGSRVALVAPNGLGTTPGTWVGDWRLARQRPLGNSSPILLTSSTSGDRLVFTTDANLEVDIAPGSLGYAAINVGLNSRRTAPPDGQLGFKLPAGAEVMATIAQGAVLQWNNVLYRPSGLIDPVKPLAGLEIIHTKAVSADASAVQAMWATVELIGTFGREDVVTQPGQPLPAPADPVPGVALVAQIKADVIARGLSIVGDCGAFEITRRVAWALRTHGYGLKEKTSGAMCQDRATDILMRADGSITDILINAGTTNTPAWQSGVAVDPATFREAIDPDDPVTGTLPVVPEIIGLHNAPYPRTPWARKSVAPISPVVEHTGTYVGTGTFIDLLFRCPVHFLYIRPLSGGSGPITWWSSANAAHMVGQEQYAPDAITEVAIDPNFAGAAAEDQQEQRTIIRIAGTNINANAVGVTYQYFAFQDPGMRFCIASTLWETQGTVDIPTTLDNDRFIPEAGFLHQEQNSATTTTRLFFKGPGSAIASIKRVDGTEQATSLQFDTGIVIGKTSLFAIVTGQLPFIFWRRDDKSDAPTANKARVVQIVSYIGDGTASRTVGLNPASGRRPMWAMVVPHDGNPVIQRDPSHTGTTSTSWPNAANAATGITAGGIDQISVGSVLNLNGVTYDVFVFPGDTVACNNGWSCNGEFVPVEPEAPVGSEGPWDPDPIDPDLDPDDPIDDDTPIDPPIDTICPPCPPNTNCSTALSDGLIMLASRLEDPANVHWTAAELTRYIVEALRTWNALTAMYKAQGTFNCRIGQPFYDLPREIPSLRAYTVTDAYLITDLQYALMEPPTPTAWTGTIQFTLSDVIRALQQARDRFLFETGMVVTRMSIPVAAAGNGRVTLDRQILTLRRVAYRGLNNRTYPLGRDDEWALQSYERTWPATTAVPQTASPDPVIYSVGVTPPLTVQVAPPATDAGILDIIAVSKSAVMGGPGPCLDPTIPILVGIPDDWTWVIRFGALAVLFHHDGLAHDPFRASYCAARFRQGLQLASQAATVLAARINGVPVQPVSVNDMDAYDRSWQSRIGPPDTLMLAGQNLVGLSPNPVASGVPILLDVVRNFPVPVLTTDCLGVEANALDAILDYAHHLAQFKEGPQQLQQSFGLLKRFYSAAGVNISIDSVSSPNRRIIRDQTGQDENAKPRLLEPLPGDSGGGGAEAPA